MSQQAADAVRLLLQGLPATLVSAHAVEREGVNAIPEALADEAWSELEDWWQARFGYGFDCLTQSEARYLERSPDVDTIRDRIAAEE